VRWIGILGIFASLVTTSADAMDEYRACPGLLEGTDAADASPANGQQPLPLDNGCETIKSEELRAPLMRIPQEGEDPMELSIGVKNNGGALRLKIPFSF
jgi:hypothetical protein